MFPVEAVSVRAVSVEASRLQGRGRLWDWFDATKIFMLPKKPEGSGDPGLGALIQEFRVNVYFLT